MILLKKNSLFLFLLLVINAVIAQTIPSKNITINDGLPSNSIKCFFKDSRGLMWIGTEAGLCCYDGTTYKIYNETNGLKYCQVWSIVEDKDKNLWLIHVILISTCCFLETYLQSISHLIALSRG